MVSRVPCEPGSDLGVLVGGVVVDDDVDVERFGDVGVDIKIGVDDRASTPAYQPVLRQELIDSIADEANLHGLRVAAHIFWLDQGLMVARSGVQGFAHNVRNTDVNNEFIELIKQKGDDFFFIPTMPLSGAWVSRGWLGETRTPEQV